MDTKTHPCPQCGQEVPDYNRINKPKIYCCRTCKSEASHNRYYHSSEEYRSRQINSSAKRKKRLRSFGLCVECGTPSGGKFRCKMCMDKEVLMSIGRSPL